LLKRSQLGVFAETRRETAGKTRRKARDFGKLGKARELEEEPAESRPKASLGLKKNTGVKPASDEKVERPVDRCQGSLRQKKKRGRFKTSHRPKESPAPRRPLARLESNRPNVDHL
jgi:hypothetical protein